MSSFKPAKVSPPSAATQRTLEELTGVGELWTDSYGRNWRVRAFVIGEIDSFFKALENVFASPNDNKRQIAFLRICLAPVECSAWVRLRRAIGMTSFSRRYVARQFLARDFSKALDAACKASLDQTLTQLLAATADVQKKMTETDGEK